MTIPIAYYSCFAMFIMMFIIIMMMMMMSYVIGFNIKIISQNNNNNNPFHYRSKKTILSSSLSLSSSLTTSITPPPYISIVTGANGYIGKAIMHELLSYTLLKQQQQQRDIDSDKNNNHDDVVSSSSPSVVIPLIYGLVRECHVNDEQEYWKQQQQQQHIVKILPYDMLDDGISIHNAWNTIQYDHYQYDDDDDDDNKTIMTQQPQQEKKSRMVNLYHIASVFGPTMNHQETALNNVKGTVDLIHTIGKIIMDNNKNQLILNKIIYTSSMAAVRGTGQIPMNGKYYTHHDWNTISNINSTSWGETYQWSKTESERMAWELCTKQYNITLVSLCPSFVFGPTSSSSLLTSNSYAIQLFQQWISGKAIVQSRLFIDVRDCAAIHVLAGTYDHINNKRYIISNECRILSQTLASILQQYNNNNNITIQYDTSYTGGHIPIGTKEVDCIQRIYNDFSNITLRSINETIIDMTKQLLLSISST